MNDPSRGNSCREFVLHVGFSKTGTTMLQQRFFPFLPEINYLGKDRELRTPRQCVNQRVFELLDPLLWELRHPYDAARIQGLVEALEKDFDFTKRIWLASWEEFGNRDLELHLESLRRIQDVFGRCRMMVVLRNPLERLSSEYLQDLRYQYLKCLNFSTLNNPLAISVYRTLDHWLSEHHQSGYLDTLLNASDLLRESLEIVGRENIGVFLYEELQSDPDRYFQVILDFLGVKNPNYLLSQSDHGEYKNDRMTEGQVRFLEQVDRNPLSKILLRMQSERVRRRRFMAHALDGIPKKAALPQVWRDFVIERTGKGNRWMENTFGVHLSSHGYPVDRP